MSSGRLALRMSAGGAWVCAKNRRKLCPHGFDGNQINNWLCKRPRVRRCNCSSARGLWTNPANSAALPDLPPLYCSVLFRDQPTRTLPNGVEAVPVPGCRRVVMMDKHGTLRCEHGHVATVLRRFCLRRRLRAACLLQCVWRAFVRARNIPPSTGCCDRDGPRKNSPVCVPVFVAALCTLRRVCDTIVQRAYERRGGKPRPRDCGCMPNGLRMSFRQGG